MERKVLKVIIFAGPTAGIYPDFSSMTAVSSKGYVRVAGEDIRGAFARYINIYGEWLHDQKSKANQDSVESPIGQFHALLLCPADFADEAALAFPETCTILNATDAATFYETNVSHKELTEIIDTDIVAGLNAKEAAGYILTEEQTDMRNPAIDTARGIRQNKIKTFAGLLTKCDITLV